LATQEPESFGALGYNFVIGGLLESQTSSSFLIEQPCKNTKILPAPAYTNQQFLAISSYETPIPLAVPL